MGRTCASLLLRKTSRSVSALYDQILAPSGLTATQLPLLAALRGGGGDRGRDLADALELDRSTISRNLALLEHRGLVRAEPRLDRRERRISLTPAGEQALAIAVPLWLQAQEALEATAVAATLTALIEGLRELAKATAEAARSFPAVQPRCRWCFRLWLIPPRGSEPRAISL